MAVVYRYPNEEQKVVPGGTRWKYEISVINTTEWQVTGKATNNLVAPSSDERTVGWFIKIPISSQAGSLIEVKDTIGGGFVIGKTWAWEFEGSKQTIYKESLRYKDKWWEEPWYTPGFGKISRFYPSSLRHWVHPSAGFTYDTSIKNYYYTDLVVTYWHPVNGEPLYTLKIFNEDTEIFSRTENVRATQVFLRQETCPTNTCPVDCGDRICCYDSDGIATYSYLK